ncbi:MAG: hypothetical protein HY055_16905 [Magnetospirillum sp.]|nr:hypothetical protein [Magnetospirillum sp.]
MSAALLLVLSVAACAPSTVPWVNSQVPKDQWSRDYSSCRRSADRESGWRDDGAYGSSNNPMREYDRLQAKRAFDAELNYCMRGLGYVPAAPK